MSNYRGKRNSKATEFDEVEELLRATEDAMVLKLSVSTHTSRTSSSSSPLDDDLLHRFEALKVPSVTNKITTVPSRSGEKKKDGAVDGGLEKKTSGDVFDRFSSLKCGSSPVESNVNPGNEMVGEEDEVSKLIQWAIDAARLDPSMSDCEEEEDSDGADDSSNDLDDDEDEDEEEDVKKNKKQSKKKKKKEKPIK